MAKSAGSAPKPSGSKRTSKGPNNRSVKGPKDPESENLKQRFRYHLQKSKEEIRAEYRRLNRTEASAFRRRWEKTQNFDWVTTTKKHEEQHLLCMHTFWFVNNLSYFEAGFASRTTF
jgi:hypothetical protein